MTIASKRPTRRMFDLAVAVDRLAKAKGYSPTLREVSAEIGTQVARAHALAHGARDRGLVAFEDRA